MKEPYWIPVSCNQTILNAIICKSEEKVSTIHQNKTTDLKFCKSFMILIRNKCYAFLWGKIGTTSVHFCIAQKSKGVSISKINSFSYIFDAVSYVNTFPTLIFQSNPNVQVVKVQNLFGKLRFVNVTTHNVTSSGNYVCAQDKVTINIGLNIFHCKRGGFILHTYICDGIKDCPNDNSDEFLCTCNSENISMKKNTFCMKWFTRQNRAQCTPNYIMEVTGICKKYEFKKVIHRNELKLGRTLNKNVHDSGKSHDFSLLSNLYLVYEPQSEGESILLPLNRQVKTFQCNPWEIHCMEGNMLCFNITDICLYQLNEEYNLYPCRNGGHLENCAEFECNMRFKCPDYYCVPWSYVCDGKWDCPFGEDEIKNEVCIGQNVCELMFRCRNEYHRCINIGNVCDNHTDCLYHDDEKFCDLNLIQCPMSCSCLIYSITCVELPDHTLLFSQSESYISVSIFKSKLTLDIFAKKFENVKYIQIPGNNISSVCSLDVLKYILVLDISNNIVEVVESKCFSFSAFLQSIYLNDNTIVHIDEYAFHNLYYLTFLNLSSNPLTNLPSKCFSNNLALKVLNMQNVKFDNIDPNSFSSTNVKLIWTNDYKISCISPDNSLCTSYPPWYVSCSDILPGTAMKGLFRSISILTISLNIVSISLAFLYVHNTYQNFQIIVIGLNFSDILCGVYLMVIWVSDTILKSVYLINEDLWKSHVLCFTSLCIVLWFTISNQIILLYFSISRIRAVINPMEIRGKHWKEICYQVSVIHIFSLCLSMILTLILQYTEGHLPTTLCLPFVDPSNLSLFTKVISLTVTTIQSIVSISIIIINILIVKNINKSERFLEKASAHSNKKMMSQLILTTTSNILCWFPCNSVYISAIFLSVCSIDVVIWTTVAIMPVNSIINPCVFIETHVKAYFRKR